MTTLKCDWCGEEVEESMVAKQNTPPIEAICLYCLCNSHPNLKAHLTEEELTNVENKGG